MKTYWPDCMLSRCPKEASGFTLIELVIVIVMLGILAVYAMTSNSDSTDLTLPAQAQRLASDIRLAQSLAYTSGSRMRVAIDTPGINGSYSVTCVTTGCNSSNNFTGATQNGITLTGTTPVEFSTLGEPNQSATYTLGSGGNTATVTIAALTGLVSVAP